MGTEGEEKAVQRWRRGRSEGTKSGKAMYAQKTAHCTEGKLGTKDYKLGKVQICLGGCY